MTVLATLPPGRWFHPSEFACKNGTPYPVAWLDEWLRIRDLSDQVRDIHGAPLDCVSGFRSRRHNLWLIARALASGSHQVASGSRHLKGQAADLAPRDKRDVVELHGKVLEEYMRGKMSLLGGLAPYPVSGWIHVDTFKAADGHLRRWTGK